MRSFIRVKNIIFLFIYLLFFTNQINAQSSCNDSIISSSSCFLSSNNYTFYSQQSDNGFWQILDSTGTLLTSNGTSNISFTFINQGSYEIRFLAFSSGCTYNKYIYVTDIPISINVNNSTIICAGGSIDYNSLSINISNNIGNVSYSWLTSPSGYSWQELVPYSIPGGENSVNLTITDILTGCSDSENINLNYQNTSANASFNISTGNISCPGQSITCNANSINNTLYNYQWSIDGIVQNSGSNGILNTSIFPIDSLVSITLFVEDISNGCIVSNTQIINANNPLYAALDTSASHFNQELNSFVYCESDSTITDTLNNPFNILTGVDSVVIDLGAGGTQTYTITQGFDQFYLNLSESIYSATLTTYFSDSCSPVSVNYNFIYNKQLSSVNVNFGTCTNSNLCIGDTVSYFIDPQQFQMPLNAEILWVISCDSNNVDTIIWDYYDVQNNTYFTDADCNPTTPDEEYIVFKYLYGESSCGCYFNDNTIGDIYDQFRIIPIFVTACQSNAMTLGLTVYVPPIPTAEFTIIDSVCPPATISMYNNSDFGCQNSLNPNYNPSNALYGVLNPTFYYDFGNCVDSVNVPTQTQYLSNSFQTISNTYNNAGIYHIQLSATNSCTSISFSDSISIFPKPNVSFTADTVCRGISTQFISTTSTNSATVDTITCFPNDKIISVPAGLPISSFSWSMGSNQGYYANGTSSSSENPEFVFTTCGEHIVGLTVSDSLGCDSTYYSSVFVYGLPNVDFSFNNFECVGNPTCITDLSTANQNPNCYFGQLDLWQWSITDENNTVVYSNTSSSSTNFCDTLIPICNPSTVSSDYEISLIITDNKGCIDSSVQVNTIFCNPLADFDNSGVCFDSTNGGIKSFTNLSSPQNGVSFKWYFGDGDSSTTTNPTHNYSSPGTYNVSLILLGNNCNDTVVKSVEIFDEYLIDLTADTILCYSENTGSINTIPLGGFSPYNYLWNGPNGYSSNSQNINNLFTGLYSLIVTDNNGCITNDSIYVSENPLIVGSSNIDTCDIYIWNGQNITFSGNYNQTFTNYNGCDSIHTLNVIIRESSDDTTYIAICDSYTWNGTTYTTSGFYSNTYSRFNGCDSIVTINLNIVSSDTVNSSISACDSYLWNTQTITASGSYNQTFTNAGGCDSVHTLNVTIDNSSSGTSYIDTCDIYIWNNDTITYSGNYNQTFTNAVGCDSVHTLNVIINESFNDTTNITVCDSYTWDGITYTTSGFYSNSYVRLNACDSVVSINLTIVSSDSVNSTISACDSYLWNTQTITASGSYNQTFTNAGGCDSVHTLIVTIDNSSLGTSNIDTCDIYIWNGQNITSSGNYNQTFTNAVGCDSIHTLNIIINESFNDTTNITICDSYTWDGTTYTNSGFYSNTYTKVNGCDSVVSINLTIVSSDSVSSLVSTCDSYLWNTQTITASGSYVQTFTNAGGCDSVHTLVVTIGYSNSGTSNIDTCDIYIWNGQNITTSGNYNQIFTNVASCDSVHTLNVIINESFNDTTNITVCDSYTWDSITYTTSGFYSNTYSRLNGCDSIVGINLIVVSSDSVSSLVSACDSYLWNGLNITTSGSYDQTFTNVGGCDSVHTLVVSIEYSNSGTSNIDTCDIYIWNGQNIISSGNYNQTFTNVAGCDSTHTLNVIIRESFNDTTNITVCDSYTWDSITYTNSGFYSNTYSRVNGCDSVIGINLTVNKSSIAEIGILNSLINCAPFTIDSSLIVAIDSINNINNFYFWTINHSNGNSLNGTGIYPPIDSIVNENDSVEIILLVNNNYGCNSDSTSIVVKTFSNPVINFTLDTLQGCSPLTINTDTSGTTQGANYIWKVLNQNGTVLQSYNYHKNSFILNNSSSTLDSSYYISLSVIDNQACEQNVSSNEIVVFAQPISGFSLENTCDESLVSFFDNSFSATSTINSWQWDFGDTSNSNDTSTLANPNGYIYSSWGTWNVSLIITDNNQCRDTSYQNINIYPNPITNFTTNYNCDTDLLCNNTLLSFNDSSYVDSFGGSITNEYWYIDNIFADSSLYTQTFNTQLDTGINTIKHIVKTQYGCLDTISLDFEVVSIPTSAFFIVDTVCGNDTSLIELINLSDGNIRNSILEISNSVDSIVVIDTLSNDSTINYIDLSSSIDVITYYLTLTVSNCCGASIYTDSIVILPNPQVYFVTNPICSLTPIPIDNPVYLFFSNFVDTINTDSVRIDWGDGTNSGIIFPNLDGGIPVWPDLIHSYPVIGIYNICITGYNNCDSTTYCCDLEVIPNQINSDFQLIDKLACQDENCGVKVRELSSPGFNNATVNWWFDYDPNNAPYYPNLGSPDLSIAYNQFDTICWQYDTPGRYFIFHEISSGQVGGPNGPTFTDTSFNLLDTVIVFPKPDINFTSADICLYDTLIFTNNSTIDNTIQDIPNQLINSFQWYVDGVAINSGWNLSYSFDSIGTYWVKLEATSNYNCSSSDSVEITIYDLPQANFSTFAVCENENMLFTDSSLEAEFPISSWLWTIDDGVYQNSTQNSQNPSFLFNNCNSNSLVSLQITDNFGCSNIHSNNVEIYCNPIVDLAINSPLCHNNIIYFNDQSIGVSQSIINWNWNFGVNATPQFSSSENDSTSYFQNSGIQNIQLTVSDSNNCSSTLDTLIYINNNPTASFNWNNVCANENTTFNNTSISTTNQINAYYWQFSDGGFSLLENPIYTYSVNETIGSAAWAILEITDIAGCKDTLDSRSSGSEIEIHPLPAVDFTANVVCQGKTFTFINNSTINNIFGDSLSFPNPLWDFDNGAISSNNSTWYLNTTNPFILEGIYNLELNMSSSFISEATNEKCSSSLNKNVEVLVVPTIDPDTSWTNSQCGTDVEFTFNANPENVNSYYYSIEDPYNNPPAITSSHQINYTFDYPGNYTFNQYIYNQNGCYDSIVDYLEIYPNPIANFQTNQFAGCENLKIDFSDISIIEFDSLFNNGSAEIVSWNWTFDDNGVSSDAYSSNTYTTINGEISYYSPSLYVETNHGCSDYIQKIDNIIAHPTPIAKITTPLQELGPGLYNFDASESQTSNGLLIDPELFNFIWITNNDTLWENIRNVDLNYQYPPNTNYPDSDFQTFYDLCLILIDINSQFQCVDTVCLEPRLFIDYFKGLYVPNALAPDDKSGQTSYFLPKGQSLKEYNIEIFDSWGNLVWQNDQLTEFDKKPAIPWNGETLDNKPLPQGTYIWKIYAKFSDGSVWQGIDGKTTGSIYLIR